MIPEHKQKVIDHFTEWSTEMSPADYKEFIIKIVHTVITTHNDTALGTKIRAIIQPQIKQAMTND